MVNIPPTASSELRKMFAAACARPTSINEHLQVLLDTGSGQPHITEMGVGEGNSTLAWLMAQPDTLVCYDWGFQECVPTIERLRGRTDFRFLLGSSMVVEIEPTNVLFIDTSHTYTYLKDELRRHAHKVKNYLVFHDTTTFGDRGEDGNSPGLWQAIVEYMADNPQWKLIHRSTNNNGLTVLGK